MQVCKSCAKYGQVLESKPVKKSRPRREETLLLIVPGYGKKVKQAREKRGMKQEDVAKALHEKESLLSHVEAEKTEPSIAVARKLERYFGITLVEEDEDRVDVQKSKSTDTMTIGDLFKK